AGEPWLERRCLREAGGPPRRRPPASGGDAEIGAHDVGDLGLLVLRRRTRSQRQEGEHSRQQAAAHCVPAAWSSAADRAWALRTARLAASTESVAPAMLVIWSPGRRASLGPLPRYWRRKRGLRTSPPEAA